MVVIVGPTAAGKSALALSMASVRDSEIINCDSVQIYRGFDIGTGKVSDEERKGVPHHLLDVAAPAENFTAGDYRREASRVIHEVQVRGRLPIVVGGTGLYLRALLVGLFEGPARSEDLRSRLAKTAERRGRDFLHRILERLDPAAAGRIHLRDTSKVIRAIEVCLLARKPISKMHEGGRQGLEGFQVLKVGLNPARPQLARRIASRTETMFRTGLLDEVRDMLSRPDVAAIKPLGAIGYREARAVLEGGLSEDEAIEQTATATRQYAKRQMTWFRREPGVEWFSGFGDDPAICRRILDWLNERLGSGFKINPGTASDESKGEL